MLLEEPEQSISKVVFHDLIRNGSVQEQPAISKDDVRRVRFNQRRRDLFRVVQRQVLRGYQHCCVMFLTAHIGIYVRV